jgi:hypothetical protein
MYTKGMLIYKYRGKNQQNKLHFSQKIYTEKMSI